MEKIIYLFDVAFPKSGDPYYRIEKFYAHISARLGDADKARELWESVVVKRGRDTEAWIQYINFERYDLKKIFDQSHTNMCFTIQQPGQLSQV